MQHFRHNYLISAEEIVKILKERYPRVRLTAPDEGPQDIAEFMMGALEEPLVDLFRADEFGLGMLAGMVTVINKVRNSVEKEVQDVPILN